LGEHQIPAYPHIFRDENTGEVNKAYTGYVYQPADGSAGDTLIAWSEKCFTVTELIKNKYSITVRVESNSDNRKFVLTNVYAPCDLADRVDFFEDMRIMKTNITEPWALAGDFNIYRYV
jgi:hypothetical protein